MNKPARYQFVCPDCREPLKSDAARQRICCEQCDRCYPVSDGIPRFVEEDYLASFGRQWNRFSVAHEDEDRATFRAKTGFSLEELSGRRVLDAGCGGGRYCKVAARAGADVVGADHSRAVETAAQLCRSLPNATFLQADLKKLPLPPASFDFAFSIGVMHHDKNTRAVFDAVAGMVKPGGKLAVWVYRRNQWWQEALNNSLRRRTTRMKPAALERWCRFGAWLGGVPLVNKTLNKFVNFSSHPHRENRLCDTFDWYAPRYQHHHTLAELRAWFDEAGFDDVVTLPPEKTGRCYRFIYDRGLLIGSGINVAGVRRKTDGAEPRAESFSARESVHCRTRKGDHHALL